MIDVCDVFRNKVPNAERLIAYGFTPLDDGGFTCDFPILEGEYLARVLVAEGGEVGFRVFDPDGEEYLLARVRTAKGSFVGKVHLAVEEVLRDVAERCFTTEYFRQDQTRRMLGLIRERYGAEPEFLWKSLPECAALRVPGKRPWFAVVGRVGRDKFGLDGEGVVEVINLKDEPSAVRERIAGGIAYPAYHMNKQHRYTLFLDGRMSDDEVAALIEKSYAIVNAWRPEGGATRGMRPLPRLLCPKFLAASFLRQRH